MAAAVLMSTGGAAIKSATLSGIEVASLRSLLAALVLLLITPARHAFRDVRVVAVGAAIATTMVLFVAANKLTTAANTIFLQYAGPLYVVLLAPRILGERVHRRDLPHIAAVVVGLALFLAGEQQPSATAPQPALGNMLAALSGVSWAATIMGLRWLAASPPAFRGGTAALAHVRSSGADLPARRQGAAEAAAVMGNLLAFVAGLPWVLGSSHLIEENLPVLVYLGVVQVGLAYMLFSAGMRGVAAPEASLLLLIEPALNPVWAWLVHGERPGGLALLGGVLILGSTALKTIVEARVRRQAPLTS